MKKAKILDSVTSIAIVVVTWYLTDFVASKFFSSMGTVFELLLYIIISMLLFAFKRFVFNLINR